MDVPRKWARKKLRQAMRSMPQFVAKEEERERLKRRGGRGRRG